MLEGARTGFGSLPPPAHDLLSDYCSRLKRLAPNLRPEHEVRLGDLFLFLETVSLAHGAVSLTGFTLTRVSERRLRLLPTATAAGVRSQVGARGALADAVSAQHAGVGHGSHGSGAGRDGARKRGHY